MINYEIATLILPRTGETMHYAKIMLGNTVRLEDLLWKIAQRTSLTVADMAAAVSALEHEIYNAILNGCPISLGSFGLLIPSLKSDLKEFEDEVDERCIRAIRIHYRKSGDMRRMSNTKALGVHFHKSRKRNKKC